MLLNRKTLDGIETGNISLVFRRWKRPTIRSGGTLLTAIGELEIEEVDQVALEEITERDAKAAGFVDIAALRVFLNQRTSGEVYRVSIGSIGLDPREALRESVPVGAETDNIQRCLKRLDSRSSIGPWTASVLQLIFRKPSVRAADLAQELGQDRDDLKVKFEN